MKSLKNLFLAFTAVGIVLAANVGINAQASVRGARPEGWQSYKPEAGHFIIDLPADPVVDLQDMNAISKGMKAAYYTSATQKMIVVVGDLYNLPAKAGGFSDAEKRSIYDSFRNGLVNGLTESLKSSGVNLEVKITDPKDLTLGGLRGYEQEMTVGTFKGRARMLVAGSRIFMFCAIGFGENIDVASSLDSFVYKGK